MNLFTSILFVITAVPVFGLALPRPASEAKIMRVIWRHDKLAAGGPRVAMDVYNKDGSAQLINHPLCTDFKPFKQYTVDWDGFVDTPLTMNVTDDGSGTINYGGEQYAVTGGTEGSARTSCSRMYNHNSALLECSIEWAGVKNPLEYPLHNTETCILPQHGIYWMKSPLEKRSYEAPSINTSMMAPSMNTSMVKRDPDVAEGQTCISESGTSLVGNGNPHQNALNKQLSEPVLCGSSAGCAVGQIEDYTIAYTASAGLAQWITGGFSVTISTTTGQSYTCNGNPGDKVCIWKNIAHTAYTVNNYAGTNCAPLQKGKAIVVWSPNQNNAGGYFWCGTNNHCGNQGDQFWDYTGA